MNIPTSFKVISILGLIWNLMGVTNFFMQALMTEDALKALPVEQQELYTNIPMWLNVVFGIAVFSGVLGCVGLILKKSWAVPVFLLSLVTITIQMGYSTFMTNAPEILGAQAFIMPIMIIGFGAFLYIYSRKAKANGWLS